MDAHIFWICLSLGVIFCNPLFFYFSVSYNVGIIIGGKKIVQRFMFY